MSPTAGRDYPRSYAQLRGWFDEDGKCLDYLDWLRWRPRPRTSRPSTWSQPSSRPGAQHSPTRSPAMPPQSRSSWRPRPPTSRPRPASKCAGQGRQVQFYVRAVDGYDHSGVLAGGAEVAGQGGEQHVVTLLDPTNL